MEDLAVKQDYFQKLDALCPLSTVLTTNTSAISVTEIAGKAVHKERIIGTHFWNPAYLVPLVEVIDRGGLDLTYSIHKYLFPHIESSAEPSKLMVQLMDEGKLGFKTGEGFQLWSPGQVKASNETLTRGLIQVSRALGRL